MRTREECKQLLKEVAVKYGVSPALISTRLLSTEDKEDMLNGDLSRETLECYVKDWIDYRVTNSDD